MLCLVSRDELVNAGDVSGGISLRDRQATGAKGGGLPEMSISQHQRARVAQEESVVGQELKRARGEVEEHASSEVLAHDAADGRAFQFGRQDFIREGEDSADDEREEEAEERSPRVEPL